jgi:hypothetical protein
LFEPMSLRLAKSLKPSIVYSLTVKILGKMGVPAEEVQEGSLALSPRAAVLSGSEPTSEGVVVYHANGLVSAL